MADRSTDLQTYSDPIWEQQAGESALWYSRLRRYLRQKPRRSLIELVRVEKMEAAEELRQKEGNRGKQRESKPSKKPTTIPGSWEDAKKKWHWEARVRAWDKEQLEAEDKLWDGRYASLRETAWQRSTELLAKVEPMLKMPLVEQTIDQSTDPNNPKTTIIKATDWRKLQIAATLLKMGIEIGEHAIGNLNVAATLLEKAGYKMDQGGLNAATGTQGDNPEDAGIY